ncbi:hypothetical protein PYV61_08230, partial [Roseisolibacter sp. H3M3-2]
MPIATRRALLAAALALPAAALTAAPLAAQAPRVTKDAAAPARAASEAPLKLAPRPTSTPISVADLMTRVYLYADDSLMGRQVGTPWNDRATDYIAAELRRLGLEPAGENGSYFQSAVERRALVTTSSFGAEGAPAMTLGRDFVPRDPLGAIRPFDGLPIVYGGTWGEPTVLGGDAAAGKVVLLTTPLDAAGRPTWNNLRIPITRQFAGAAAVVVAALDGIPDEFREQLLQSGIGVRGDVEAAEAAAPPQPEFVWVTRAAVAALLGALAADARVA